MDKKQKFLLLSVGLLVIIAVIIGIIAFKEEKNKHKENKVNLVKEEFESLNGVVNDTGYTFNTVEIDVNAPIEKIDIKKAVEVIEKEDAVILFGYAKDNICRNAITTFLQAADSVGINKIYYVESYDLINNTSEEYQKLLEKIDVVLDKYELEDAEGNKIGTIQKKIFVPTVVVFKNKELLDYHLGTLEENMKDENLNKELTKEEKEELFDIYTNMLLKISNSACDDESKC